MLGCVQAHQAQRTHCVLVCLGLGESQEQFSTGVHYMLEFFQFFTFYISLIDVNHLKKKVVIYISVQSQTHQHLKYNNFINKTQRFTKFKQLIPNLLKQMHVFDFALFILYAPPPQSLIFIKCQPRHSCVSNYSIR